MKISTSLQILSLALLLIENAHAASSPNLRGLVEDVAILTDSTVTLAQPECTTDSDCPEIWCLVPPCDQNKCVGGFCTVPVHVDASAGSDRTDNAVDIVTNTSTSETIANATTSSIRTDDLYADVGINCGPTTCVIGDECCNESCGYCVAPGDGCTKEFCNVSASGGILPEEGDDTTAAPSTSDTGGSFWSLVSQDGQCSCDNCSICQKIFSICIQINCN